ncbi:MAG: amidohydrolase [Planctomycetota bacterium]|jgi:predicted amidohydrolase|nr:amidohydrolase [Planctomycetota bacterium]
MAADGEEALPEFPLYKAAAINCDPRLGDKAGNVSRQLVLVEEAAGKGAKLIAVPEMATTGYCWHDRREVAPFVETIPGPTTDRFLALAEKYGCWIVLGLPEVDAASGVYYNSAALIGPDGVAGVHRKTHPYISEPKWAKQGDLGHRVFRTPIGNLGLLICMDIHFSETARLEALNGADVIVHVSNWLAEKTPAPYWITRAFENGCYVLEANRSGWERTVRFSGGSALINPDGTIQSRFDDGEGIVFGEIDVAAARRKDFAGSGHKFRERRPAGYLELLHDPYLWNPLDFFRLYNHDPLPPGRKSRVAAIQMNPVAGDVVSNLGRTIEKARQAAAAGADLAVFPELTLNGPVNAVQAEETALEIPERNLRALLDVALEQGIHLVVGLAEREGGRLYNSALLLGPEGIAGKYRKTHLDRRDSAWAVPGDPDFPAFNLPLGRVGLLIGHDALFPEPARILALRGADLLCCPSAVTHPQPYGLGETAARHNYPIPRGYHPVHWHLWRVRGGENNCYLAFANMAGESPEGGPYFGSSGVFSPDTFHFPRHERILPRGGDGMAILDIDTTDAPGSVYPTNVVRRKDLLRMRQPLWYDDIVRPVT